MIIEVNDKNINMAAEIHSLTWKDSHKTFCSPEFIALHTVENQEKYLHKEIENGKRFYMLIKDVPVGIVSVKDNLIENLYVKPDKQHNGYGTTLLKFALKQCTGKPVLWVLDNNVIAYEFYSKYAFHKTGNYKQLSKTLSEIEMEHYV